MDKIIADIVVVGAGVFGLSSALFLSAEYPNLKVILLEQLTLGHEEGSSHSEIRIIRSIYNNPFYRDLCVEGIIKYWPQVQRLLEQTFITPNPCLYYVESEAAFKEYEEAAKTSQGQILTLPLQDIKQRFPTAPKIETNLPVFLDTKSGVIFAQKYLQSIAKYLRTCSNITILEKTRVISFANNAKSASIVAVGPNGTVNIQCDKIILSCGRWIGSLIPEMAQIAKEVRQTVSYWQMKNPEQYIIGKFPCWVHSDKNLKSYYGLPDVNGVGMKFAHHNQDHSFEKSFQSESAYIEAVKKDIDSACEKYFGGRYEKQSRIEKCYYTVTKTGDFVIDWSDEHENILVVSPCSGHGFKFGPVIGKIASSLVATGSAKQVVSFERNRYLVSLCYHLGVNLK